MGCLTLILGVLVLSGCTATVTTPVSMPIWLVLGLLFLLRLTDYTSWRSFTKVILLQTSIMAVALLTTAPFASPSGVTRKPQDVLFQLCILIGAPLLIIVSLGLVNDAEARRSRKIASVMIHVLVAIAMMIFVYGLLLRGGRYFT